MHESDERRVAEAEESAAPTTPAGGLRGVLVAASALLAAAQDRLTELETRDRERDQVLKRSQDTIRIYRANAEEYGDGVREAEAEIKALANKAEETRLDWQRAMSALHPAVEAYEYVNGGLVCRCCSMAPGRHSGLCPWHHREVLDLRHADDLRAANARVATLQAELAHARKGPR